MDAANRLRVRVQESPVDGQANRALIKLLADRLGVPISAVRIVSGLKSRNKVVELAGFDRDSAMQRVDWRRLNAAGIKYRVRPSRKR